MSQQRPTLSSNVLIYLMFWKLSAFCLRLNCCKFIKSDEKETSEKEDDKEEKEKGDKDEKETEEKKEEEKKE